MFSFHLRSRPFFHRFNYRQQIKASNAIELSSLFISMYNLLSFLHSVYVSVTTNPSVEFAVCKHIHVSLGMPIPLHFC